MTNPVHGTCDPAFAEVRREFERNLTERGDVGASLAVTIDGREVIDLWGGYADDDGRAWEADTLACVYSVAKGATTLCAHLLVEAGELDLDAPVARYWPEFAQAGKEQLTVASILSHEAGMIGPREVLYPEQTHDWDATCAALARAEPWWEPGTRQGYHAVSFGYLVGEIVRRISGLSLGTFLSKEITSRLGADFFIGTPDTEHDRCARILAQPDLSGMAQGLPGVPELPVTSLDQHPVAPVLVALGHMQLGEANSAAFRRAEIPGSNAHASARGIARLYAATVAGDIIGEETLARATRPRPMPGNHDVVLSPMSAFAAPRHRWTLGFQSNQGRMAGASPQAFGHGGISGAMGFADPVHGLALGYVTNTFASASGASAGRLDSLVAALYDALPEVAVA